MPKVSVAMLFVACLLLIAAVIPLRAEDELDPAFQRVAPEGPNEIIPENYPRSDWGTRYVDDATRYLEDHPSDQIAPRMYLDLIMVAQELHDRELEQKALKALLLGYPRTIQAHHATSTIHKPSEFLRFLKYCLADEEYSATAYRRLILLVELGSQKWGGRLWSHDRVSLCTAILCSLELDTLETQAALEQEFSKPGQWDRLSLLQTLRDKDATHEQVIAAIFDSGVDLVADQSDLSAFWPPSVPNFTGPGIWRVDADYWPETLKETSELFLPELGMRLQADGAEEFFTAVSSLHELHTKQRYEEFLEQVSVLRKRYPSKRLEWARILVLANLGRFDEARAAAEALNQDHPRSEWSSLAVELTGTFDGAEQLCGEQAELLAAVDEKYRESEPSKFRLKLFHDEFRTIEGDVVPAGSLIGEFDRNRGSAFAATMGDEVLLKMTFGSDAPLRLYLPSLNRSQIFAHDGNYSRYGTAGFNVRRHPETGAVICDLVVHANDEDQDRGFHRVQFDTSFSKDKAGYQEFLKLMQHLGAYPVSHREDGETIEIAWRAFSPFQLSASEVRWRSRQDGGESSVSIIDDVGSLKGGLTFAWGDETSQTLSGIKLPDLPERTVPVTVMLPEYFEQVVWSAHKYGLLAERSDREVARFIKARKSLMDAYRLAETYKNPSKVSKPLASIETVVEELISQESEQALRRKYRKQEVSESKSDKSDDQPPTFLEYALPGNPKAEIDKQLQQRK